MSPLSEIAKRAAIATSKGAGITLASTTASLYLACQIEIKGHQTIYHFFPEKYADVKHANGLTQEQLEAARELKEQASLEGPLNLSSREADTGRSTTKKIQEEYSFLLDNKFWKEEALPSLRQEFIMPSQEIIACSMEG